MGIVHEPGYGLRRTLLHAYHGLVLLLMVAEVLGFSRVARAIPDSAFWQFLAYHQSQVACTGCSLHDLIQPFFSFLVGRYADLAFTRS